MYLPGPGTITFKHDCAAVMVDCEMDPFVHISYSSGIVMSFKDGDVPAKYGMFDADLFERLRDLAIFFEVYNEIKYLIYTPEGEETPEHLFDEMPIEERILLVTTALMAAECRYLPNTSDENVLRKSARNSFDFYDFFESIEGQFTASETEKILEAVSNDEYTLTITQ